MKSKSNITITSTDNTEYSLNSSGEAFVPAGTYTIGEGGDYATIADAFAFLEGKFSNGAVTLQLLDGTHEGIDNLEIPNIVCSTLRIQGNAENHTLTIINFSDITFHGFYHTATNLLVEFKDIKIVASMSGNESSVFATFAPYANFLFTGKITVEHTISNEVTIASHIFNSFGGGKLYFKDSTLYCTGNSTTKSIVFTGKRGASNIIISNCIIHPSNFNYIVFVDRGAQAYVSMSTFNSSNVTTTYNITTNQINNTGKTKGSVIYLT